MSASICTFIIMHSLDSRPSQKKKQTQANANVQLMPFFLQVYIYYSIHFIFSWSVMFMLREKMSTFMEIYRKMNYAQLVCCKWHNTPEIIFNSESILYSWKGRVGHQTYSTEWTVPNLMFSSTFLIFVTPFCLIWSVQILSFAGIFGSAEGVFCSSFLK